MYGMMIFLFVFGLIIGSFLNVIIYRLPRGMSIVLPRSHCPACSHRLGAKDLIPLFSFIFQKGRCRYCGAIIPWRYPVVELLTGILTVLWWIQYGIDIYGITVLLLTYGLIAIAFIDLEHMMIPDWLTIPLLLAGLSLRLTQGEILPSLSGALTGGLILSLIAIVYPQGMGWGDVKLLGMVGAFLDWRRVLYVLFLGSLSGTLTMLPLTIIKKVDGKTRIPFGPFLVLAALAILYW